ncbi:hypothetical protein BGW42_007289 [Actinomortierella wolfii]|nr:hypothetical protein BGW42_007289 [Actinomortierella wolfii]
MARSRSIPVAPNAEKRVPPPVKPKPAALVSRPSQDNIPNDNVQPSNAARPPVSRANSIGAGNHASKSPSSTNTSSTSNNDSGIESTSTSFGDLKKAFERNPNMSPLFQTAQNNQAPSWRAPSHATPTRYPTSPPTPPTATPPTAAGAALLRKSLGSGSLRVPPGVAASRPRSASTPAPPVPLQKPNVSNQSQQDRDPENRNGGVTTTTVSSSLYSTKGQERVDIDDRQPDFSNIRARFQNQEPLPSANTHAPVHAKPVRATNIDEWDIAENKSGLIWFILVECGKVP